MKAQEMASKRLVWVNVHASLKKAEEIMNQKNVAGVLVRDDSGEAVGVLTREDIAYYDRQRLRRLIGKEPIEIHLRPEEENVESWITPSVLSVDKDDSLALVVRTMLKNRADRVYVKDPAMGRLVGVVSVTDVLKHLIQGRGRILKASRHAVGIFLALAMAAVALAAPVRLSTVRSQLWLEGDSTLHPYESTATIVNASGIAEGSLEEAAWGGKLESFDLSIPVESLRSHSKKLDKNMYASLKSKDFSTIDFHLMRLEASGSAGGDGRALTAEGSLRIAGKAKDIALSLAVHQVPEGLDVRGDCTLLMSDYGIKPPSLMLGAIKVADKVTIHFDLLLKGEEGAGEAVPTQQKGEKP